jgi:hypothetical protein
MSNRNSKLRRIIVHCTEFQANIKFIVRELFSKNRVGIFDWDC